MVLIQALNRGKRSAPASQRLRRWLLLTIRAPLRLKGNGSTGSEVGWVSCSVFSTPSV